MNSNKIKYLSSIVNRIIKETIDSNIYEITVLFRKVLDVYMEGFIENDRIMEAIAKTLVIHIDDSDPSPAHPPFHLHSIILDLSLFLPGDLIGLYTKCFSLMNKRLHVKLMTVLHQKQEYWQFHVEELLTVMLIYQKSDDFDLLILRDRIVDKLLTYDGTLKLLQCMTNESDMVRSSACDLFISKVIQPESTHYFHFRKSILIDELLDNLNEYANVMNLEYHVIQRNALTTPRKQQFHLVAMYSACRCVICNTIIWGFTAYASLHGTYHLNCIYDDKSRSNITDLDSFDRVYSKLLNNKESYHDNERMLIIDLLVLQYILLHKSNELPECLVLLRKGIKDHGGLESSTKKLYFSDYNNVYPLYHAISRTYFEQSSVSVNKVMYFFKDIKRTVVQQHVIDLLIVSSFITVVDDIIPLEIPVFTTFDYLDELLINAIDKNIATNNPSTLTVGWWLIRNRCHFRAFKSDRIFNQFLALLLNWFKNSTSNEYHDEFYHFIHKHRNLIPSNVELPPTPEMPLSPVSSQSVTTIQQVVYHLQTKTSFDCCKFLNAVQNPKIQFIYVLHDHGKRLLGEVLQAVNKDPELTAQLNIILFKYRVNTSTTWISLMTRILNSSHTLILGQLVLLNFRVADQVDFNRIQPVLEWLTASRNDLEFQIIYAKIFATLLGCSTELSTAPNSSKSRKPALLSFNQLVGYIVKYFTNQETLLPDALCLLARIIASNSGNSSQLLHSILNHAWNHLDFDKLKSDYDYSKIIANLLAMDQSSIFLMDFPHNTKDWLCNLNKISYFMDAYIYITDYTLIMTRCLLYCYKSIVHDDPVIRHAGRIILELKFNMVTSLDNIFTVVAKSLLVPTCNALLHLMKSFKMKLFSVTKLLDIVSVEKNTSLTSLVIELLACTCIHPSTNLSDYEILMIRHSVSIHLGYLDSVIKDGAIKQGPLSIINCVPILHSIVRILHSKCIVTSKLRLLQIDLCLLLIKAVNTCLVAYHSTGINTSRVFQLKQWLTALYVGLYYNASECKDLLPQLFDSLIDACDAIRNVDGENCEYILFVIQYMIEQQDELLAGVHKLLNTLYSCMDRFKVNSKDHLAKQACILLCFVLQRDIMRSNLYTWLSEDSKLIDYIEIIASNKQRWELLNESLNWEELRIDFYNRLLIYGIDSLVDVGEHFQSFIKVSTLSQYSQQHPLELTRIVDEILKKSSVRRINSTCAGYFLMSIGYLIKQHGYCSALLLENLRFNLDSFLCCFDDANANVIGFFDILKDVDIDLFEFTVTTIFKSKLNKNTQNRAYSKLLMKYLDELADTMSISVNIEETMENAFDSGHPHFMEIGYLATRIKINNSSILLSRISTMRVLKAVIVLLYSGFKSHSFHFIRDISKQHLELCKMVLEAFNSGESEGYKQELLKQLILLFKLTSFIQAHVLSSDSTIFDDILKFEYSLWYGTSTILKSSAESVIVASLDLLEFVLKCNADVNSVLGNGLVGIMDKIEMTGKKQRYISLKEQYESIKLRTPGNSMKMYIELEQEIKRL
eukprot:NODE_13_length_42895_cov_0.518413.p1 type:complete len:1522 gc:universal NODE_13_length_42895_cov_0.518413:31835-27270(-)